MTQTLDFVPPDFGIDASSSEWNVVTMVGDLSEGSPPGMAVTQMERKAGIDP